MSDTEFEKTPQPKRKSKKVSHAIDGQVVLVDENKVPEETHEVSSKLYEKQLRPKKEMSEKQRANLERLIEMNRKKREDKKAQEEKEAFTIPDEIPDGKKAVVIKSKRPYNKTEKVAKEVVDTIQNKNQSLEEKIDRMIEEFKKPKEVKPKEVKPKKPKYTRPIKWKEPQTETETETEETEMSDDNSDMNSDMDYHKIEKKVNKRVEKIKQLDHTIQQAQQSNHPNKYIRNGMSIF
jgi:hypothetical protein